MSFDNTKTDIAESDLGKVLSISANTKWNDIISKIKSIVNRGAWTGSVGVNGKIVIPAGYHNGNGYINNSVSTMGSNTYTPSSNKQTINCSGKYMTGNIYINAIPSNYINPGTLEVFKNGSFSNNIIGWDPYQWIVTSTVGTSYNHMNGNPKINSNPAIIYRSISTKFLNKIIPKSKLKSVRVHAKQQLTDTNRSTILDLYLVIVYKDGANRKHLKQYGIISGNGRSDNWYEEDKTIDLSSYSDQYDLGIGFKQGKYKQTHFIDIDITFK